jgi:5-methylcytosine-specific restriction endonuclease McrA
LERQAFSQKLKEADVRRLIKLNNVTCVYCGVRLDALKPAGVDKDHVIGRRFVPKGKLAGQWNLVVRVCKPCHKHKSDLEDDLSAISMHPDTWGLHAHADEG